MKIRSFAHGEGPMNTLGGLHPDTVKTNITGSLRHFWHVLNDDYQVVNWNGEVSPVVHQLDHFHQELSLLADRFISTALSTRFDHQAANLSQRRQDLVWQLLPATRCLFDCRDSPQFDV